MCMCVWGMGGRGTVCVCEWGGGGVVMTSFCFFLWFPFSVMEVFK